MSTRHLPLVAFGIMAVALVAGCGPKAGPTDPTDQPPIGAALIKAQDTAQQNSDQADREKIIGDAQSLVAKVNEAIAALDATAMFALMTEQTKAMFVLLAQMDMAVAGIQDMSPQEHVVSQQKDFDVVYTLEDIDPEAWTATLVGVVRNSGNEVRFPIQLVPGDGVLLFDYTEVLSKRIKNMTKVLVVKLVERVAGAVKTADAASYTSAFSPSSFASCPDPFAVGPAGADASTILAKAKASKLSIGEPQVNAADLVATIPFTLGDTQAGTITVTLVLEGGTFYMDASSSCTAAAGQ